MELPCIVEKVTYRKDNFAILACNLDPYSGKYNEDLEKLLAPALNKRYNSFTVILDSLDESENPTGGQFIFAGDLVEDPKRGWQYKATFYYQDQPSTEEGMQIFLMSLPNIKASRSHEIIKTFGLDGVIDVLDNRPDELIQINGISRARIPAIKEEWDKRKVMRDIYEWFVECNLPIKLAEKAFSKWREKARTVIQDNPYRLTDLQGIGFQTADRLAHKISNNIQDDFRTVSCMRFCLEEDVYKNSNLCTPYNKLKRNVLNILRESDTAMGNLHDSTIYSQLIPICLKNNLDVFAAVKDTRESVTYVYLSEIWQKERYIGESLVSVSKQTSDFTCNDTDINKAEKNISFFAGREIILDDKQKEAIASAFNNKITVITGGGGTGKSTICRCIYTLASDKKLTVNMMSPTGKAAQVLSEKTGGTATTIHRGLEMNLHDPLPGRSVTQEILLIDETSMSGVDTMYALMVAIESNPRVNIVFVGDKNQLPSVSPGNFLSDIIDSKCANVVTLDKIHRQDENSYISLIANAVSQGQIKSIPVTANDIKWHRLNPDTIDSDLCSFIDTHIEANGNIDDLQVISPMKKGRCGVFKLNEVIQRKMAEHNGTTDQLLERDFKKFHVGDRIIQITNNYDKNIFNGDMGVIKELGEKIENPNANDTKKKYITVDFFGNEKTYYGKEMEEIILAWAITVHKFQGSQSKNIVMMLASEAQVMMNKELVYTGFTRAEKHLDIFGHDQMYRLAPTRSVVKKRFTSLTKIIEEIRTGEKFLRVLANV